MKVFISYAGKDEALAAKVVASLEEAGLDAWYAKREITPGENWGEKIAQGLKESDAMVVLLTPDALESNSVSWDINYALGDKAYSRRLIPVMVGDLEEFSNSNIPWILKHLNVIKLPERGSNNESLRQIAQALKDAA